MTLPQWGQPIVRANPIDISELTGVVIAAPLGGDILIYDGVTWRNQTVTGDITVDGAGLVAIAAGVIVDADISATAEIQVSKLADGAPRQLLQTAADGVAVEWASNIDIPGTLDVTLAVVFDLGLTIVAGDLDMNGVGEIVNIGAAGNDFGAAQLDVVAGYIIRGAGALIIRTAVDNVRLEPSGDVISDSAIRLQSTSDKRIENERYSADANGPLITVRKARGTIASPEAVDSGDILGFYSFLGYDGAAFSHSGRFRGVATEDFTGSAHGTKLEFYTTDNGTTVADLRMTIDQDGTVALGANDITMTGDISVTGARVNIIYTVNQTTTNAETVDSWGQSKERISAYMGNALGILRHVSIISFRHLLDRDPSGRMKLGVLAESIREPLALVTRDYGYGLGEGPALDTMGLASLNTKAIQEIDEILGSAGSHFKALERENERLTTEVERLRSLVEA